MGAEDNSGLASINYGASHGNVSDQLASGMLGQDVGNLDILKTQFNNATQQAPIIADLTQQEIQNMGAQHQSQLASFGNQNQGLQNALNQIQGQNALYQGPTGIFNQEQMAQNQRAQMAQFQLGSSDAARGALATHGHGVMEQNLGMQNYLAQLGLNTSQAQQALGYQGQMAGNQLSQEQLANQEGAYGSQYSYNAANTSNQAFLQNQQAQQAPQMAMDQYYGQLYGALSPLSYLTGSQTTSLGPNSAYNAALNPGIQGS